MRSVSLSSIYSDLGFEKMALVDGAKSSTNDPSNYSAHRFLSDIYASQSRHEIARVSELLQSQLLQPLNGNPLHPQAAQNDLNIFRDAGLSGPTFNEYTPLFNRNQMTLSASGLAGGRDTWGDVRLWCPACGIKCPAVSEGCTTRPMACTVNGTYVDQAGEFDPNPLSYQSVNGGDNFWVVDASLRYRLPRRYGMLGLEVRNLFDEAFQFQTLDPSSPEYVPQRWVLGKLTISF